MEKSHKLNWRKKAENIGINVKKYISEDGNPINGWYIFKYEEYNCIAQNGTFSVLIDQVDEFAYFGHPFCSTSFDNFIGNFKDYTPNTAENKKAIKKFLIDEGFRKK